jgi:outer membrane protein, multidrug efflux system
MNWKVLSFGIPFLLLGGQGCVPATTQRDGVELTAVPLNIQTQASGNASIYSDNTLDRADINGSGGVPDETLIQLKPWWNHWNSDLDTRLTELRENNLKLLQQHQQLEILQLQADIVGTKSKPELFATAKWSETQIRGKNSVDQSTHSPSVGFLASWELDLWGKLKSQRQSAFLNLAWSSWQRQQLLQSLESELVKTWIRYVAISEDRLLLQRQISDQKKLLDYTETRFRQGQSTSQECWQQREAYYALQKNIAPLDERQELLAKNIQLLTGQDFNVNNSILLKEKLPTLENPYPETLPSSLLANHPSVQMAWNKLLQADENAFQNATQRLPNLSLSGSFLLTATQQENLFQNWINQLSASLLLPLFDAGQRKANVEIANTQVQSALLAYTETVRQTYYEICQTLSQYQQHQQQVQWLDLEKNARQQVLEEAEKRYAMGQETATNVWRFRQSHYLIERELLSLNTERLIALVAIQQSLGPQPSPSAPTKL